MPSTPELIEFPADDPQRARAFWAAVLGAALEPRGEGQGEGWQTRETTPAIGVHLRGRGPGDSFSLPYFKIEDMDAALENVRSHGGTVIHPGAAWSICKDTEGTPFGLHAEPAQH